MPTGTKLIVGDASSRPCVARVEASAVMSKLLAREVMVMPLPMLPWACIAEKKDRAPIGYACVPPCLAGASRYT